MGSIRAGTVPGDAASRRAEGAPGVLLRLRASIRNVGERTWAASGRPSAIADSSFISGNLMFMLAAGGVLCFFSTYLPGGMPAAGHVIVRGLSCISMASAVGIVTLRRRIPNWFYYVIPGFGWFIVSAGTWQCGYRPVTITYVLFYVFIAIHVFTVMAWRVAAAYLLVAIAITYAVFTHTGMGPAVLFMIVGGLSVIAFIVGRISRAGMAMEIDPLTGALNRRGLERALPAALGRSARTGSDVVVVAMDLDHFKVFNDRYGHAAGDDLLRTVVRAFTAATRHHGIPLASASIARQGGDEFTAVLTGRSATVAVMTELVDTLREALPVEHRCTAGIAAWTPEPAVGMAPQSGQQLLERADAALYKAKRAQRGSTCSLGLPGQDDDDHVSAADLARAVEAGELVVHYQPVIDATGRPPVLGPGAQEGGAGVVGVDGHADDPAGSVRIVGVEALVRWAHPRRGLLSPPAFLPEARHAGLMPRLGVVVLAQALRETRDWVDADGRPLALAVNASSEELAGEDYASQVLAALVEIDVAPPRLCVEVTQADMRPVFTTALTHLRVLREAGVRVAIDDFTAEAGALAVLTSLPVDLVKLHPSLAATLPDPDAPLDPGARSVSTSTVLAAIIDAIHDAGVGVIVEGVEQSGQVAWLREHTWKGVARWAARAGEPVHPDGERRGERGGPAPAGQRHTDGRYGPRATPPAPRALIQGWYWAEAMPQAALRAALNLTAGRTGSGARRGAASEESIPVS